MRAYEAEDEIREMVVRSAYAQLNYSPLLLAAAIAGMLIVFVAPLPVLILMFVLSQVDLFTGGAAGFSITKGAGFFFFLLAALPIVVRAYAYIPTMRLYSLFGQWLPNLTLAGWKYCGMTLESARRHRQGQGGAWKGRTYSELAEVKRADKGTAERRR